MSPRPAAVVSSTSVSKVWAEVKALVPSVVVQAERPIETSAMAAKAAIRAPVKPDPTDLRAPLVLPKDTRDLPPPQTANADVAALPVDNTKPNIDTAGMSQADIERARHARVVDINTPDGRPLTAAELKTLTAKMKSFTLSSKRSIFTPPEQYFSLDNNQQDLVCLSKTGDLVSVNDPSCPVEIRNALLKKKS
jgi:hypothetical protein